MKVLEIQSISDFGFLLELPEIKFYPISHSTIPFQNFNGQGPADLDERAKKTLKLIRE